MYELLKVDRMNLYELSPEVLAKCHHARMESLVVRQRFVACSPAEPATSVLYVLVQNCSSRMYDMLESYSRKVIRISMIA